MKWTLISTSSTGIKEYHLTNDNQVILMLKYSIEQQSVRIRVSFANEHLVFLMEPTGFANRIFIKSAYGVELGKFLYNSRSKTGNIDINKAVLQYIVIDSNPFKLIIHKRSRQEPMAVCHLPVNSAGLSIYEYACFVLSVYWYTAVNASNKV